MRFRMSASDRPAYVKLLAALLVVAAATTAAAQSPTARPLDTLPVSFERNVGQAPADAHFVAHGAGHTLLLTRRGAVVRLPQGTDVLMRLLGATTMAPDGEARLPGVVNYFVGADPSAWRTDVPTFQRARYERVYDGIDLVYYGHAGRLEYDFVVAPGANPTAIRMSFDGANRVVLEQDGSLSLYADGGRLTVEKPVLYQDVGGVRSPVEGRFELDPDNVVSFVVGRYDRRLPLTIDPVLVYSSFAHEVYHRPYDVHVAGDGSIFIAGIFEPGGTSIDAYVSKLAADGSALLFTTYIGGTGADWGKAVTSGADGSVYVTGQTFSFNFPLSSPAQSSFQEGGDAFVVKLAAAGNSLVYATYLGGNNEDAGNAIAVDVDGNAYIAGATRSDNFPRLLAQQTTRKGAEDAFITKYDPTGVPLFSTYVGGGGSDAAHDALLVNDGLLLAGQAGSYDFPTTPGVAQPVHSGSFEDGFVAKVSTADASLIFSTYVGGGGADVITGVAVDASGAIYVTGDTSSSDFPVTPGVVQPNFGGSIDSFVAKLSADATVRVYATYLGGPGFEANTDGKIAVAADGSAVIVGAAAAGFPLAEPLLQSPLPGLVPGYVTRLNPTGTVYMYSTLWPGVPNAVASGPSGDAILVGTSNVGAYPTTPDARVPALPNITGTRGFLSRISDARPPCTYHVRPDTIVGPSGVFSAAQQISVVAPSGCGWTAVADVPWIQLGADAGSGLAVLDMKTTSSNPGATRSGTITIGDKVITVYQPSLSCSYALSATPLQPSEGSTVVASVTAGVDCPWVITPLTTWLTVSPSSGVGNGSVTFTLQPNSGLPTRTAQVALGITYNSQAPWAISQAGQCNLEVTPNQIKMPRAGGTALVGVTASPEGCAWTTRSETTWLTAPGGSGSGNLLVTVPANLSTSFRSANLLLPGRSISVTQDGAPSSTVPLPNPPSPPAGSGATQTFSFTFFEPNGVTNLDVVNVLVNNFLDGRFACYLAYVRSINVLYLVNDAGDGLLPGVVLDGSPQSLANGQCAIDIPASSASTTFGVLTLTLRIGFEPSFAGNKVVYQAARDLNGNNSGWVQQGVWHVPGGAPGSPSVVDINPARGGGRDYPFTFTFRDADGFSDLVSTTVLVNSYLDGGAACYFGYHVPSNTLLLLNDAGNGYMPGLTLGGQGTVENTQCRIMSAGSGAVGSGTDLTLTIRIVFKSAFKGERVIYVSAQDSVTSSGWQAVGSWSLPQF